MEKYYFLCSNWDFDINQATIFLGTATLLFTIVGFCIAIYLYEKQRNDNSDDAYKFFKVSLTTLDNALEDTINSFADFINDLRIGSFHNPSLSPSINDSFITKINILDLNRYYKNNNPSHVNSFEQLISDSNFLATYNQYFTNEFNYVRENYLKNEEIFSQWQLLRSNLFYSVKADPDEREEFIIFYEDWINRLNIDRDIFRFNASGEAVGLINRRLLIDRHIRPFVSEIFPYIEHSERANNINLIGNKVIAGLGNMVEIENSMIRVFESDLRKFREIKQNVERLL